MKKYFFLLMMALLGACTSQKLDPSTLPKDISLKPKDPSDSIELPKNIAADTTSLDPQTLKSLRLEIEKLATSEVCTDPTNWRMIPMGEKSCGGPERYIAYPKIVEHDLIEKVQSYTRLQTKYYKSHQVSSDCTMVLPPSKLACENGKSVFIYEK